MSEPHRLLGQLSLGDVELGPHVPDLTAGLIPHRLPGAGAPADLAGAGYHPVLLVPEGSPLGQAVPLGQDGGPVLGMDVLEEFLVPQVFLGVPGEPLEGRVYERQPAVHVVGNDPFPHGGGDRLELALDLGRRALGPAPAPALPPERGPSGEQQRDASAAG